MRCGVLFFHMRILSILLLSFLSVRAQTTINNFDTLTNDRFANDPSFVGAGLDFSGIGRTTQGSGRFATLISDNVFLTANHFRAAGEVTFFADNDPNSTAIVRTVTGGQQLGDSDLFIGIFDRALPSSINRFGFSTQSLDLADNILGQTFLSSLAPGADVSDTVATASTIAINNGPTVFLGGISPSLSFSNATSLTIGTNTVEAVQENSIIGAVSNSIALLTFRNEVGDAGFNVTAFESDLNGGDSGSPLLTEVNGELVLLGLGSGSGSVDLGGDIGSRDTSIFSFTGNYSDEIQDFIDINAVPEPSTTVLMLLVLPSLFLRQRRA